MRGACVRQLDGGLRTCRDYEYIQYVYRVAKDDGGKRFHFYVLSVMCGEER